LPQQEKVEMNHRVDAMTTGFGRLLFLLLLTAAIAGCTVDQASLPGIRLPPGFRIALYARELPNARSMALGDRGTLFVGTRSDGRVYALRDADGDGRAERKWTLARGLDMPNGVAFRNGALYVAESGRILRFDRIEERLDTPPEPVVVATVRAYGHHGWRYIGFGPDGRLYVAMGAPCNVCEPGDLGSIVSMRPDGGDRRIFARGVRNSVGFTWHPQSSDLWFTDNGRDWLGDDLPPDELNRADGPGRHFGFPYCHGGDIADPEFGAERPCSDFTPPVQRLGPHVASLGVRFYNGDMFPERYRGQLFIAEHGSWNRSSRVGYRITLVRLEGNRALGYEPFASGWLRAGSVAGRPVDLVVMPDGALLVSDDKAGAIYRISYDPGNGS
jgi:glucose/arabinose dehydrogenase